MYKSKIYQSAYMSKEIFMFYIFKVKFILYVQRLKNQGSLNVTDFFWNTIEFQKKKKKKKKIIKILTNN